jgi:hypothetical protein
LQFVNEDVDQDMVQRLFLRVDHEVVVVDIELTNHTNDDDENDIDHLMLDNEHIQPEMTRKYSIDAVADRGFRRGGVPLPPSVGSMTKNSRTALTNTLCI